MWCRTFRIPLNTPFWTARGSVSHREGLLLWLKADDGTIGIGEGSPSFARMAEETLAMSSLVAELAPRLAGCEVGELLIAAEGLASRSLPQPLRCALDVATCDIIGQRQGLSVARLLHESPVSSVAVNAIIGAPSPQTAASLAAEAASAGFSCVKLKVGGAGGTTEELARIVAVRRELGPEIKLRLDANGAWSAPEAIETIQALEEYDLELVEQPVPPGNVQDMRLVRESVNTPIAADEGVTDLAAAIRLLEARAAQVLVVKPMVVGGLRAALEIAKLGERRGVAVIVTTTIDSGVGTAAALHLAAALPSDGPACGLATTSLLKASLLARPLTIEEGRMPVPAGPGLGIEVDEQSLRLFASPQTTRYC